ncbi:hypothetical protein B0H14DRAFT_3425315 [Mycena olivaceomarginata]|nr:hypothetical protein B0H14DRAFT_3425315 [Mycena olivaceomarginata]
MSAVEPEQEASLNDELIAKVAVYSVAREYEKYLGHYAAESDGKPLTDTQTKALLTGSAGAFIAHLVEGKKERVKDDVKEQLVQLAQKIDADGM